MGGSVSVVGEDPIHVGVASSPEKEYSSSRRRKGLGVQEDGDSGRMTRPDMNHRIFQKSTATSDDSHVTVDMLKPNNFSPEVMELLRTSMSGFFWLQYDTQQKDDAAAKNRIEMIIKVMQKEEISAGSVLIKEGAVGDKLYVVEKGEMLVTINGETIRTIGPGALFGELALIYDSPRSATVTATSDCVVYSLLRMIFKRVLAISRDASSVQRSRWLLSSPELAILSPNNLARLVSSMKTLQFNKGAFLYKEMALSQDIMLIERGTAKLYSTMDLSGMPSDEVDRMFGVLRPPVPNGPSKQRQKSVADMKSLTELQSFVQGQETIQELSPRDNEEKIEGAMRKPSPPLGTFKTSSEGNLLPQMKTLQLDEAANTGYRNKDEVQLFPCGEVSEGCILGIGSLRGRAGMPNAWRWVTAAEKSIKGIQEEVEMAETPFTVEAATTVDVAGFTVQSFENLFGAINKVFSETEEEPALEEYPERTGISFDVSKFKIISVLGSGSFGTVTLAEYDDGSPASPNPAAGKSPGTPSQPKRYALKSLSKVSIIETSQQRHVMDEKKLLFQMDNPFIIKLFGVYQTPHQLIMVTEAIECGDLWGVIYEEELVSQSGGIPCRLAQFYSASLIYALDHMHSKNIAYRDLKPENVMVDRHGYLRVIDFGFAKRVPYQKTEADGSIKVCMQTFTLCGTPEYLPPELIFNLGHDKSSDLWSLGVVIYEMIMGRTPFAPKKPHNITELFTNIAMAKKNGLLLSSRMDERTNNTPAARELVTQLLKPEPMDRLGGKHATADLLRATFFSTLDVDALRECRMEAPFVPEIKSKGDAAANLQPVKAYYGDQSLFEFF